MKGLIALDIDGTISKDHRPVEKEVAHFFKTLNGQGWEFIFISGRALSWMEKSLAFCDFPYGAAPQNGSVLLEMPQKKEILCNYISASIIDGLLETAKKEGTGFAIYTGWEKEDKVIWDTSLYTKEMRAYLEERAEAYHEIWETSPYPDYFSSVKWIGKKEDMERIAKKMEGAFHLHCPVIRDPYRTGMFVAQATHPDATKGAVLQTYMRLKSIDGLVIAAGDDLNDETMLKCADIKIVMKEAPQKLIDMADIVAPSVHERGIVHALKTAIEKGSG